jgi:hypothetical protein
MDSAWSLIYHPHGFLRSMRSLTYWIDLHRRQTGAKRLVCIIVLLLLCIGSRSEAEDPKQTGVDTIEASSLLTISKAVDEVRLNFTVTDKSGEIYQDAEERRL